jgi:hypothetical protein
MNTDQLPDFTELDDSALLSLRARMREELAELPPHSPELAALTCVYDASTEEITERARRAWAKDK